MRYCIRFIFLTFCLLMISRSVEAQPLLNEWRSIKSQWQDKGVDLSIGYIGEFLSNTKGGIKRDSSYLSNLDIGISLDTARLGWWENGTFYGDFQYIHDTGKPADFVGDLQGVSNIAAARGARLYELWYEHQINEGLSLLGGLYDVNSEFAIADTGAVFLNSSFGIQPDIASNARPGIFPVTAPGGRIKYEPNARWSALLGIFDGDPGSETVNKHNTRWNFDSDQGALLMSEIQYHRESNLPGTYKIGFWANTGEFEDVAAVNADGSPITRDGNLGGYVIMDQALYRESDGEQGLSGFIHIGGAPDNINQVDFYSGGGLSYAGLLPNRESDIFGIAIGHASISNKLKAQTQLKSAEIVYEASYKAILTEHIAVQPDLQYVQYPGGDPAVNNALIFILRFELTL